MASSGSITINLQSIDYTGALPSGTCYNPGNAGSFGRGQMKLNTTLNWVVNDSNLLSFSYGGSMGSLAWYVCSYEGYYMEVQWSPDQSNWTTIASSFTNDYQQCIPSKTTESLCQLLLNSLAPVQLTQNGYIRIYTWTPSACPTVDYPFAYPTQAGSQAVSVPIYIEVSWDAYVQYNCEGGSGCPGTQHKVVGDADSTTFTVPSTTPTRTWYRFEGYSTTSGSSTVSYRPGDTVTVYKNNPTLNLYAVWTPYYRPGAQLKSGVWKSHQRNGGACNVRENGVWVEKRTIDGGSTTNDPPQIRLGGQWKNMHRIGDET